MSMIRITIFLYNILPFFKQRGVQNGTATCRPGQGFLRDIGRWHRQLFNLRRKTHRTFRPQRLRQIYPSLPHLRFIKTHLRKDLFRRPGCDRASSGKKRNRPCFSELCPLSPHDSCAEYRLSSGKPQGKQRAHPAKNAADGKAGAGRGAFVQKAGTALRRPAAEGCHRTGFN